MTIDSSCFLNLPQTNWSTDSLDFTSSYFLNLSISAHYHCHHLVKATSFFYLNHWVAYSLIIGIWSLPCFYITYAPWDLTAYENVPLPTSFSLPLNLSRSNLPIVSHCNPCTLTSSDSHLLFSYHFSLFSLSYHTFLFSHFPTHHCFPHWLVPATQFISSLNTAWHFLP